MYVCVHYSSVKRNISLLTKRLKYTQRLLVIVNRVSHSISHSNITVRNSIRKLVTLVAVIRLCSVSTGISATSIAIEIHFGFICLHYHKINQWFVFGMKFCVRFRCCRSAVWIHKSCVCTHTTHAQTMVRAFLVIDFVVCGFSIFFFIFVRFLASRCSNARVAVSFRGNTYKCFNHICDSIHEQNFFCYSNAHY